MAKALKTVGTIAGVVASVAALIPGGQPIALVAAAISTTANVGSALLAKPPVARGSTNAITIGANQPTPYLMGRTYTGGNLVYDRAYGGTVDGVPNPYRLMVTVASLGPVEGLEQSLADFSPLSFDEGGEANGWYDNFLYRDFQLGACPEPAALVPKWAGAPAWGPAARISGKAAIARGLKFDKKGERWGGGVPQFGEVWRGVLVYDARQDSTYPGGAGACRALDEGSYVGGAAGENPGCHALTYALGRYQNGQKVFGIGLNDPEHFFHGIVLSDFVELANICDANGWTIGGEIFEPGPPGIRWDNLKNICAAGGAEPVFKNGLLGLRINTPRVSLGTIGMADLLDIAEAVVPSGLTWRDKLNTLIPRFRSEAHKWEYVPSSKVTVPGFLAEDGEEKVDTRQLNLVQRADQAAQIVAYELYDRREIGPIELPCGYALRNYPVGVKLTLEPDVALALGLEDRPHIMILQRAVDPTTMAVTLTVRTETDAKHAAALGLTGSAPEVPLIVAPDLVDQVTSGNSQVSRGAFRWIDRAPLNPVSSTSSSVVVEAFTAVLDDGRQLAFPAQTFAANPSFEYRLMWRFSTSAYVLVSAGSQAEMQSSDYFWVGDIATLNDAGEAPPIETPPPGGGGYGPRNPIP